MNRSLRAVMGLLIALTVLLALGAFLTSDDLGLSLALGGGAVAFMSIAGLVALANRMPPLPPFVLAPTSIWQGRVARSLAGDRLARLEVLESLDRVQGASAAAGPGVPLHRHRQESLTRLSRSEFSAFLQRELQRAEDEG